MAQHAIELTLWMVLAFLVGGTIGCALRRIAAARQSGFAPGISSDGAARGPLASVEPSGTAAPLPR